MRIGILSMQTVYNYGSVLQAYSLKQIVNEIIDAEIEFISPNYDKAIPIKMPVQDAGDYNGEAYLVSGKLNYFIKKVINKIKLKAFKAQIKKFQINVLKIKAVNKDSKYDCIIEGSDEVFKATRLFSFYMYGGVPNTEKLITYAASSGSAVYEGLPCNEIPNIKKSMSRFSAMSVRDIYTEHYISKIYGGKIERNMDPVLVGELANREHKRVEYQNYIVIYAYQDRIRLKEEILEIRKFAKEKGLKTIALGAPQYWCDQFLVVSPLEVLDFFYFSQYVITDTFHGAIFSIINHCNFAVLLRDSNRNKLTGLMNQVKLQHRIAETPQEIKDILRHKPDYKITDEIISREKLKTKDYLKCNLK